MADVPIVSTPQAQATPTDETSVTTKTISQTAGDGQSRTPVQDDWRLPGTEKFKTAADLAHSYLELQPALSKAQGRRDELERHYAENIVPFWDQYVEYVDSLRKAGKGRQSGDRPGDVAESGDDGANPELKAMEARLASIEGANMMRASAAGEREFWRSHPEAKEYDQQIADLIKQQVVQIRDFADPQAYVEAGEAAYDIVRARTAEKKAAAREAAKIEGGGGPGGEPDVDLWALSLSDLKKRADAGL